MSDPSLVQVTFNINPDMPVDMKRAILALFTDYYTKYYPDKDKDIDWSELSKKYPVISELCRNDSYHNVTLQVCQLDSYYVYDIDTNEFFNKDRGYFLDENGNRIPEEIHSLGVSIITLPRYSSTLYEFFKLVGPYISSCVSTLGICHHTDYGTSASYFYQDSHNNIREHVIEIDEIQDNLIYNDEDRLYNKKCNELRKKINDAYNSKVINGWIKEQLLDDLEEFGYDYVMEECGL